VISVVVHPQYSIFDDRLSLKSILLVGIRSKNIYKKLRHPSIELLSNWIYIQVIKSGSKSTFLLLVFLDLSCHFRNHLFNHDYQQSTISIFYLKGILILLNSFLSSRNASLPIQNYDLPHQK